MDLIDTIGPMYDFFEPVGKLAGVIVAIIVAGLKITGWFKQAVIWCNEDRYEEQGREIKKIDRKIDDHVKDTRVHVSPEERYSGRG